MIKWINKRRKRKGFSLVELVAVVAILGILAAVAVPRFTGSQETARKNAHAANVATLKSAANIALAENGNPSDDENWEKPDGDPDGDNEYEFETKVNPDPWYAGKYLDTWPKSPWDDGREYTVTITEDGSIVVKIGEEETVGDDD